MYSMVLMAALTGGADVPDMGHRGRHHGCCGGCWGACYGGSGCYGAPAAGGGCWGTYPARPAVYAAVPVRYAAAAPYADAEGTRAFYYNPGSGENASGAAPATIVVHLPATALLTIDGEPTRSNSDTRTFTSPPLQPGRVYHYVLRGEFKDKGRKADASRNVEVRAGKTTEVYMDFPLKDNAPERLKPPAQPPAELKRPADLPPPPDKSDPLRNPK